MLENEDAFIKGMFLSLLLPRAFHTAVGLLHVLSCFKQMPITKNI